MPYLDSQTFYDGKNEIYGYKTEVAVHGSPPHYCMFVSEHVPGSVHDYVLHKSIYQHYVPYLHMTEDEIQVHAGTSKSSILADYGR